MKLCTVHFMLFQFFLVCNRTDSELRGKTAAELTSPDSPIRNLLSNYASSRDGLSIKTSSETLSGYSNGHLHRSCSKVGPVSPGAESALSLEEVLPNSDPLIVKTRATLFLDSDERFTAVHPPTDTPCCHRHPIELAMASTQAIVAAGRGAFFAPAALEHFVFLMFCSSPRVIQTGQPFT